MPLRILPVLIFAILASTQADAQRAPKMEALNRRQFLYKDTLFQFYTINSTGKSLQADADYYWYRPDTILVTRNGFDGRLLNGVFKMFYPNKNLKESGAFNLGLKTGEWKQWYSNGKLKSIVQWQNSSRNGKFREFDENGILVREGFYSNGQLSGNMQEHTSDSTSSKIRYKNGKPVPVKEKKRKEKNPDAENATP